MTRVEAVRRSDPRSGSYRRVVASLGAPEAASLTAGASNVLSSVQGGGVPALWACDLQLRLQVVLQRLHCGLELGLRGAPAPSHTWPFHCTRLSATAWVVAGRSSRVF